MTVSFRKMSGFTLLEVMVALLISAIGLLGLAALQVSARNNLESSFQYSQASLLAQDLAERMRANPVALRAGMYDAIDTDAVSDTDTATSCSGGCNPETIAGNDIIAWASAIKNTDELLIGIGRTELNGNRLKITVLWDGDRVRYKKRPTDCPPLDCLSIEVDTQ